MRPVQRFSREYLEQTKGITAQQSVQFVEDARHLYYSAQKPAKSRLISIKVPEPLLNAFKSKALSGGLRYQTQIKKLMADWLKDT
jgi:predicted DNA binding CopG/RHH family protein